MKSLVSSLLIVIFVCFPFNRVHAAAPTDFVSCWEMDETSGTRVDTNTTNANDLTDNNTVLYNTGVNGNAADFENSNSEYLNDTSYSGFVTGNNARSVSMWLNFESTPSGSGRTVFSSGNFEGSGEEFTIYFENISSTQYAWVDKYGAAAQSSALTISTGTWYHFVMTFDGSNVRFYWDNSAKGTPSFTMSTVNTDPLVIGGRTRSSPTAPYAFFDGLIDIVEYYDRALTTDEITALYNSGSGVACAGRSGGGGGGTTSLINTVLFE